MRSRNSLGVPLLVTAFMLFSMFFGAGNLIFPPMLGVEAGTNFTPAMLGFLGTGVLLPVLGIIAIAISGDNLRDLALRGGRIFGLVFPVVAYLAIGAFYALPRTGAVAYETALQPITGWDSVVASAAFNAGFFGVGLLLAWHPGSIVKNLGKFLTPVLLTLLAVLVVIAVTTFNGSPGAPAEKYATAPLATGLLEGYLTMDSIASLAFGIIVVSALRHAGVSSPASLVRGTIIAGLGAGLLLGVIYVSLGVIGQIIPDPAQYPNGAGLLADAAHLTLGAPGQVTFGGIVFLACLTTAVGLIAATSEFFHVLIPRISYRAWAVGFTVLSFALATLGLDTVLQVAAPVIEFIYPPAITLIAVTLLQPLLHRRIVLLWTFRLAIWAAVVYSALDILGAAALLRWSPGHDLGLGWVLPTAAALVIGVLLDARTTAPSPNATAPQRTPHTA